MALMQILGALSGHRPQLPKYSQESRDEQKNLRYKVIGLGEEVLSINH